MSHDIPLITTIVAGLVLAFLFGSIAHRLKMPPLVGYLLAGIAIGPFTPGFVGDVDLAQQLAEIGVILLMFGVGLHFSLKDLLAVKGIAIPGALAQIILATLMGMAMGWLIGWPLGQGLLFGLALSVASTVVLLTALQERRLVETRRGQIAIGWLIVEDIAMVLALVLIPALSGILGGSGESLSTDALLWTLAATLGKVVAFIAAMLLVGRRLIPWTLERVAASGSRELFRLAVLAIALGFALGAAYVFGVSFALGAFFAGMILGESDLSHRAAEESLPLRDAFAVLFFVSVGMLFDPSIVVREPLLVLATVAIIVVGKSLAALAIVRAFGHPASTALTIAASLAQIGEFSFILATLGVSLGLLSQTGRDLILGGAIISILLNPLLFVVLDRLRSRKGSPHEQAHAADPAGPALPEMTGHAVLVGFGRVGHLVALALTEGAQDFVVIEDDLSVVQALRRDGVPALYGNAVAPGMMELAQVASARWLLLAIPDALEAGHVIAQARKQNPGIDIIARAHSNVERLHLEKQGANQTIMGEREIAAGMAGCVLGEALSEAGS
ncbi:YbaL family putative K(+) efflux transporter [Noviherbaspirillum soli]|uniref:YbaL family putative K(+) efflux transporter n=1 Tax=Noviherbaspirillum soli TaxID=1064518 RepID=UPI001889CA6E|nr:YbaL family putative K(+) efflux transporter [Noviherbaspirillum soli]